MKKMKKMIDDSLFITYTLDLTRIGNLLHHLTQLSVLLCICQMTHDQTTTLRIQSNCITTFFVLQTPVFATTLRDTHANLALQHFHTVELHRSTRSALWTAEADIGRTTELFVFIVFHIDRVHIADTLENLHDITTTESGVEIAGVDGAGLYFGRSALFLSCPVLLCFASLDFHGKTGAVASLVFGTHLLTIEHEGLGSILHGLHLDIAHTFGTVGVSITNELDCLNLYIIHRIIQIIQFESTYISSLLEIITKPLLIHFYLKIGDKYSANITRERFLYQ